MIRMSLVAWLMHMGLVVWIHSDATAQDRARDDVVTFGRFQNCVALENETVRVVVCPESGGRILEYSLDGQNSLFVSAYDQGAEDTGPAWKTDPSAGRFDIGPELMMPKRDELFRGKWDVVRLTDRSVQIASPPSESTGVQLIRDFTLDAKTSRLECTQTIVNVSSATVRYCHWSRTLANGAGIVLVPLEGFAKFPNRYVRYDNGALVLKPSDPNVRIRDGFLEIIGPPPTPKLGMDSFAGWVAHQQPSGLLFIKQFPTYPDRPYVDAGGITLATWAPPSGVTVEIEPIGPAETIEPGGRASFTEVWWLMDGKYPGDGQNVDLQQLRERVQSLR